MPLHGIQHTLLNTESRTAGILAATSTVLLSLFSLPARSESCRAPVAPQGSASHHGHIAGYLHDALAGMDGFLQPPLRLMYSAENLICEIARLVYAKCSLAKFYRCPILLGEV